MLCEVLPDGVTFISESTLDVMCKLQNHVCTRPRICDFIDGRIKRIIPLRNSVAAPAATLVLLEADDVAQGVSS